MKKTLIAVALLVGVGACSEKSAPSAGQQQQQPSSQQPQASAPAAGGGEAAGTPIPTPDITISTAAADVQKGQEIFATKGCVACHKVGGGKLVGPDLKGVMTRREQEWVEKMILRPDVMLKEDATARKLLAEHMTPMPNQGVDPEKELPFILAYLKANP